MKHAHQIPQQSLLLAGSAWAGIPTDLEGNPISTAEFEANMANGLPGDDDQKFIQSLMYRVTEPGKIAGWIAPPDRDINAQAVEYWYVKL